MRNAIGVKRGCAYALSRAASDTLPLGSCKPATTFGRGDVGNAFGSRHWAYVAMSQQKT